MSNIIKKWIWTGWSLEERFLIAFQEDKLLWRDYRMASSGYKLCNEAGVPISLDNGVVSTGIFPEYNFEKHSDNEIFYWRVNTWECWDTKKEAVEYFKNSWEKSIQNHKESIIILQEKLEKL